MQHPGGKGGRGQVDVDRDRGRQVVGRGGRPEDLRRHAAAGGKPAQVEDPGQHGAQQRQQQQGQAPAAIGR